MRPRLSWLRRFQVGVAALLVCALPALAALTGDIRGLVLDPQNLPVEGAQVTLKNQDTGLTRVTTTDSSGSFSELQLDVGTYQVRVERSGFRVYSITNIAVRSGEVAKLRMPLEIGSVNQIVTVTSGADAYLDTASAQVAMSLDALTIQSLPTLDRDPVALANLSPGVVPVSKDNLNYLESGNFNANGQRARSNNITVDNAVATDIVTSEQAGTGTFSLDSVQEVTLITSGLSAEFGRNSGSQEQIITVGGSNEIHGTAYWFLQNSALNARDYFQTTGEATPFDQNLWGFTIGGPVIKNKLFLTGDYQGIHSSGQGGTQVANVLTPAQAAAITDPTSLALFNAVGAPQSASGVESNSAPNDTRQYAWSLRGDETFGGGKDLLTARYSTNPVTSVTPSLTFVTSTLPNYGAIGMGLNHFLNVGYSHTFSPAVINQTRFEFARAGSAFDPYTDLRSPYAPVINISGYPAMGVSPILPQSRVENIFEGNDAVSWAKGRHGFKFGVDIFKYQDNSVLNDVSRGEFFYGSPAAFQSGEPEIYAQFIGNPERGYRDTDVFLNAQDDIRVTTTFTLNVGLRLESSGGVSEVHNVLSNLDTSSQAPLGGGGTGALGSINVGGSAYNRNTNWAPRLGAAWNPGGRKLVLRAGYGLVYDFLFLDPIIDTQFSPPYAYALTFSGAAMTGNNSYADFAAGKSAAQRATQASIGTFPSSIVNFGSISPVQENLKNPRTQQWDAGAEYQIAKDFVFKVTYIGSSTDFLQVSMPINLVAPKNRPSPAVSEADELARYPSFLSTYEFETGTASGSVINNLLDPRFNSVVQLQSVGQASYEGVQFQALKVFSHGISFQASYTYGHAMDDVSDALPVYSNDSAMVQNPLDLDANWGPSAFDVASRFVLNGLFEIPWTKRFAGIRGKLLHGWAADGIITAQSGLPASIFSGAVRGIPDVALIGGGAELANGDAGLFHPAVEGTAAAAIIPTPCSRGVNTSGTSTCTDASGFPLTQPLLGTFGDSGRNRLRLDGLSDVDLGVYKNTRVNEKLTVQFRWETYNLFNHPNFSGFVNTLTSPIFGTYTSTSTNSRRMQFALKLMF